MTEAVPITSTGVRRVQHEPVAGRKAEPKETTAVRRGADQLEVSTVARMLGKLKANDIRQDLVDRVKGEIAKGTYETPEKLEATIDALIEELSH